MAAETAKNLQKSYFDVLGICCPSEVPMIENILKNLDGVKDVSVVVPTRTVVVVHDVLLISQLEIVKVLNKARLEANVKVKGGKSRQRKWPSPYAMASGVCLLLSVLKYVFTPMQWLALVAVAVGIIPILLRAIISVRNCAFGDINILIVITVAGSIALRDYWEAGTIVFLFAIADWLESLASHKATEAMSSLLNLVPQRAILAETGEEVDVTVVKISTVLAVKEGEMIPIDGVVLEGNCDVDEKTLTGESFPVSKQKDSEIWAGTINVNGYITIRTTALAEDCVVARMTKLVEEAQSNKSRIERFMEKFAKYYTPAIVMTSAVIAIVPAIMRVHNQKKWFHLALVVLVSACPCALVLSTPVAMFCALTKAAKLGVFFKGADYLEMLAKVKIMAFDKTGTITRAEFEVTEFRSLVDDISLETLLYWVSSVESKSGHPMAAVLVEHAKSRSVEPKPEEVQEFLNFPGEGIFGKMDGKVIFIGNTKISARAGCQSVPKLEGNLEDGKSVGYIFLGSTPVGIFCLADVCRTGAKEALKELKSMGIKSVMITGDCYAAAKQAQDQLEGVLETIYAELLPEDKARIIQDLQKQACTAMIGDGINDAPALATADVGISMGVSGSSLATETGHVILMTNDIQRIPKVARLARKVKRKIIENMVLSVVTKGSILALALAGHPIVWAAVLADVGTCLLVVMNSMLLLGTSPMFHKKCCKSSSGGKDHSSSHHKHDHHHHHHDEKHTEVKTSCCGHVGKNTHTHGEIRISIDDRVSLISSSNDGNSQSESREGRHHHHGGKGCCSSESGKSRANNATQVESNTHSHGGKGCCSSESAKSKANNATQVGSNTRSHGGKGCCSSESAKSRANITTQVEPNTHSHGGTGCCSSDIGKSMAKNEIQVESNTHSHGGKGCCSSDSAKSRPNNATQAASNTHSHGGKGCCNSESAKSKENIAIQVESNTHSHGGKGCCISDLAKSRENIATQVESNTHSHGGTGCCSSEIGKSMVKNEIQQVESNTHSHGGTGCCISESGKSSPSNVTDVGTNTHSHGGIKCSDHSSISLPSHDGKCGELSKGNHHHGDHIISDEEIGTMVDFCCNHDHQIRSCCSESLKKECCVHKGHFGTNFRGGLAEIVIE